MHFLVTGGAGYVGSHIVRALQLRGDAVTVLDNFSTGHRWAVSECQIIEVDLRDSKTLAEKLHGQFFDGVFHFAAKSLVGESNQNPLLYFQNNVVGTGNLVEMAIKNRWGNFIFSSSAAVYGNPVTELLVESHPKEPINFYGRSKLMVEQLLENVCDQNNFSAVCLRYFNAAGASRAGDIGECHEPETHLIPNAFRAVSGKAPNLTIHGDSYNTPDGTCIRDYIHVEDLASAHLLAMDYLRANRDFDVFNLGNGKGFSVKEVLRACEQASRQKIPYKIGPKRPGDPARLVADSTKATKILGWKPQYPDISAIVNDAWNWEKSCPN